MKLTEKKIKNSFDRRSFERGNDYQRSGYVVDAIQTSDLLWGSVAGSQFEPYQIKLHLEKGTILSECSCPVGDECKHGVALALEYIRRPESFTDLDKVLVSLKENSKEELIALISDLLQSNPGFIRELGFVIEKRRSKKGRVNINAVKGRIDHILSGDLDYYHISHVEEELIEVCEIGETLQNESNFYNAAEVHLIVAEGVVEAFELGADDSSGSLGGIAQECVESFCLCAQEMNEEQATKFLARTIRLSFEEDYGLETENMVIALANNSNLSTIETLVKEGMKDLDERVRDHSSFSYSYNRRKMKELLSEVYSKLGMKERAMDILLQDIRTRGEYVHVATALMHEKRYAEALDMLRRAPKGHNVNSTYFQVLDKMPKKEIKMHWNTHEAVKFAFLDPGPLSRYIERDRYNSIRDIFLKAGAVDEIVAEAQCIIPGTEVLATLFLYECESEKAASVFKKNARISGRVGIRIGSMAWKQRKKDLAMEMTRLALKRGVDLQNVEDEGECKKIIEELLKRTPKNDIQGLVDSFKMDRFLLMFIAEKLIHIRPDIARTMLEKNLEQLKGDFIVRMIKILGRKEPKDGLGLGVNAFDTFSKRSHIYYDVMIDMLKAVKPYYWKVLGEKGWDEYLDSLRAKFKTRKKLMKMIDGMEREMEKKPSSENT